MGQQVIPLPGGGYGVWSSVVDDWLFEEPITEEQYISWMKEKALKEVERDLQELFVDIKSGKQAYFQFTQTFLEAEESRRTVHGGKSSPLAKCVIMRNAKTNEKTRPV